MCGKSSNIKFRKNHFSGGRVVLLGQTDGQTDMTTLTVVFRNFATAPDTVQSARPRHESTLGHGAVATADLLRCMLKWKADTFTSKLLQVSTLVSV